MDAKILKCEAWGLCFGQAVHVHVSRESRERLYLVRYSDGDIEHLTADQVQRWRSDVMHLDDEARSP